MCDCLSWKPAFKNIIDSVLASKILNNLASWCSPHFALCYKSSAPLHNSVFHLGLKPKLTHSQVAACLVQLTVVKLFVKPAQACYIFKLNKCTFQKWMITLNNRDLNVVKNIVIIMISAIIEQL